MTPLAHMTKPLISQLKVFNEYTESMQSNSFIQRPMRDEGPSEDSKAESDMEQLEKLFKKISSQYGIDKMQLLRSLLDGNTSRSSGSRAKTKNILQGISNKEEADRSIDRFSGVDFLMDENILTNDSREEDSSGVERTPGNRGINQINSAGFSN